MLTTDSLLLTKLSYIAHIDTQVRGYGSRSGTRYTCTICKVGHPTLQPRRRWASSSVCSLCIGLLAFIVSVFGAFSSDGFLINWSRHPSSCPVFPSRHPSRHPCQVVQLSSQVKSSRSILPCVEGPYGLMTGPFSSIIYWSRRPPSWIRPLWNQEGVMCGRTEG